MDDRLNDLYHGVPVGATANAEHIAALELLALVMAADEAVNEIEIGELKSITDDWRDGDFTFDKYLTPAINKARQAIEAGSELALINDIDERISSRVLRRALFSAARDLAGIDHDLTPQEGTILAEVAVRFG